jgi:restriction endonuclease Mrr
MEPTERNCPKCGGALFEYATYVDGWHVDGDWYEYETISCITCATIRYEHTIHCSEYSGSNDHYDDVKREVGVYDEHGQWRTIHLDRLYESAVPESAGFSPGNYRPWWGRHKEVRRDTEQAKETQADANFGKANLISPTEEALLFPTLKDVYLEIVEALVRGKVKLHELSPRKFEEFMASLFANHGYEVTLTQATRDGGYDVIAIRKNPLGLDLRIIIECKRNRPDRPVELSVARALWGVITDPANRFDRGIIATTSRLSRDARHAMDNSLWRLGILEHEQIMNYAGFVREGELWIRHTERDGSKKPGLNDDI